MAFALLSILALLFAPLLAQAETTSPVFFWSGRKYFDHQAQHVDQVYYDAVTAVLRSASDLSVPALEALPEIRLHTRPQVIVAFVDLQTRIAQLGKMNNLQAATSSSESSLTIPYVSYSDSIAASISTFAKDFAAKYASSTTIIVNGLAMSRASMSFDKFLAALDNEQTYVDGETKIFIVHLADTVLGDLASADSLIGRADELLKKHTDNYLAVYSPNHPSCMEIKREFSDKSFHSHVLRDDMMNGTYTNYFPIPISEALIVAVVLLTILLVGVICTCSVQTPSRFETPKIRRADL